MIKTDINEQEEHYGIEVFANLIKDQKDINKIILYFQSLNNLEQEKVINYITQRTDFSIEKYIKNNLAINTKIIKREQFFRFLLINFLF